MGQNSESLSVQKLRGGYYTPPEITEFICKWCIDESINKVLEPSCGDGEFIEAAINRFRELNNCDDTLTEKIKGIELIKEEAFKAATRARKPRNRW